MSRTASLRLLRQALHISPSQITTYLNCSLRYELQYVKGLAPEHVSSSLLLGTAVHGAIARYFESLKETGEPESSDVVIEFFRDALLTELGQARAPVLFKSDAPDADALIRQGEGLLEAFLRDPGFQGLEVVAVELPLSTPLCDPDGNPTDYQLVGVIDLLLRDELGHLVAIDHKTAKNPYTQDGVDADMQLSAYAHLLRVTGHIGHQEPLNCGFNVLRKLKSPKVERYMTLRNRADSERFVRLAHAVLAGIDAGTFLPSPGWQCSDCPYQIECRQW